jgi:hypothetical protein
MRAATVGASFTLGVVILAGCGSGTRGESPPVQGPSTQEAVTAEAVPDGVYRYRIPADYLRAQDVNAQQATEEGGVHTVTLSGGTYTDAWASSARARTCTGRYTWAGARITIRWTTGCSGDWAMTGRLTGDQVRWSDIQSLPPDDSATPQAINTAFNSVPWTRIGDAGDAAASS